MSLVRMNKGRSSRMSSFEIVCATKEESFEFTLLGRTYQRGIPSKVDLHIKHNNKEPLSKFYNYVIDSTRSDYLIFCHDDVSIDDHNYLHKIVEAIGPESQYSICGVAGMTKARIVEKNLWHLMSLSGKPFDGASGAVAHYTGKDDVECFMTNFGTTPARVTLLDGVFIAVNVKEIREAGLRFDEECPSKWNFYDLLFCLEANKLGLKMTTWPIWITHKSHGLTSFEAEDWTKGNEYLINELT